MGSPHLASGSQRPPKEGDKLRLYSMLFCPYCERVRMVLILKNIPHDVVNVNLKDKPEWLYELHPKGLVPALDIGDRVITESLDIVEYLDETYPDPPLRSEDPQQREKDNQVLQLFSKDKPEWLYELHPKGLVPALDIGDRVITESLDIVEYLDETYPDPPLRSEDPQQREKDNQVLQLFSKVPGPFYSTIYDKENKPLDEYMNEMYTLMDPIEQELASRGSLFFGGDKPGFLDYMMWPWTERSKVPSILFNETFTFPKERFSHLVEWRSAMKEQPGVRECLIEPERHARLMALNREADNNGTSVDYESV